MPSLRALPLVGAFVFLAARANADTSGRAAAQVLFDQARKLMTEANYAKACPKLQESQRLDPGGGTILLLARCHDKAGKTATAWTDYQEALRVAIRDKRVERERLARTESAALEARLSKLVVTVPDATVVPGLRVARDGDEVGPGQWTLPVPVDPGAHEVAVSAPGTVSWRTAVNVRGEGTVVTVVVPPLRPRETPPSPLALPASSPTVPTRGPEQPAGERAGGGAGQRAGAVVAGAIGIGLVGVGTVYALTAKSTYAQSREQDNCDAASCTPAGVALQDKAFSRARVATLLIGVGAAAVAGGVTLWLTAPHGEAPALALGVGPGHATMRATW